MREKCIRRRVTDLPPGRELDALIAKKVMGYHLKKDDCNSYWIDNDNIEPNHTHDYSTDISAAWQIVEKLRHTWWVDVEARSTLDVCKLESQEHINERKFIEEIGDSAPHAICLAALRTLG